MSIPQTIKFLILGNSGVGKTNIMEQYTTGHFYESWITTVGIDFRSKVLTLDERQVKIQIWDTAGQERYRTIVSSYYRGAHAIVLVYDVTDRSSFDDVRNWLEQIHLNADEDIKVVVVGNKIDLSEKRKVSFEEGKALAEEDHLQFFEVSAKVNYNIEEVFLQTTKEVLNSPEYQKKLQKNNVINVQNKPPAKKGNGCCGNGKNN